jgi:hypothetical protein
MAEKPGQRSTIWNIVEKNDLRPMKPPVYTVFILLMLAGNAAGLYKLWTDREGFFQNFRRLPKQGLRC